MNKNSHALRKAAVLILGLLTLSAAALLRFPRSEVEVYGNFSPHDLSQIKHVALRHIRVVALGNLKRSILKPTLLPVALKGLLTGRVCSIDRCWNNEVSVNTGSPWIGCLVLVSSNGEWCIQGSSTFPPPREPVPDADPFRRHRVFISVPTGLRSTRKGNAFDYVFTGFETARLMIGYKMITGVSQEVDSRRYGKDSGTSIAGTYGGPLPHEIPPPSVGYSPNEIPVRYRITIFETDQPPGYHVDPSMGKFYRVLLDPRLRRTFRMSACQLIRSCVSVVVMAALTSGCCDPNSSKHLSSLPMCYRNPQYGFVFYLPASWRGYEVSVQQWESQKYSAAPDRAVGTERGPILVLRHPQWTASSPYQDISILIFTRAQWETHHAGSVGAGGVDEEISHNSKYVFAISSRYNANDSVKGWKETSNAVECNRCERPHLYAE